MENKWITIDDEIKPNMFVLFEKEFVLDELCEASICITADDYYKLKINGRYVGQGPAPCYTFSYAYNRYDITEFLTKGKNKIEALVYYQGLTNRVWVSGDGRLGLAADIFLNDKLAFGTDCCWSYRIDNSFTGTRTTGYDTIFLEDRDMRQPLGEEKQCVEATAEYTLEAEPYPAVEVYSKRVEPQINGSKYFYDFGEEYAGNLKITASGGGEIIIRCAEELENGAPRYRMRCSCDYEEHCILKEGLNVIEQYDYKAFRFVEIEALNAEILDVELLIRHYPFPEKSLEIITKNENLKRVFDLCKATIKYGTQEAFIDCPTREKGQYTGDIFISGFAYLILTNDSAPLKRAIKSIASSIKETGRVQAVSNCSYKQEIADYSLLLPLMLWRFFKYTNDKEFLKEMLPACEFICNYFSGFENSEGLLENATEQWNLVDWPESLRDNYEFSSVHNAINAIYYSCNHSTEMIKNELGIKSEAKSEAIKSAYNKAFLHSNGLYANNDSCSHFAVHSNMLPRAFGISKDNKIADYLVERGMECGTYMSYFYLKALCNAGRKNDALNAITADSEHSWLNMINEGASRCFEAWGKEQKWNTSLFHPWSASPIIILYEDIAGDNALDVDFEIK